MKMLYKLITICALTIATLGQHSTAAAVGIFMFRGLGANASFESVDGCIQTNVDVFTAEATIQTPPGSGEPFSSVDLFISQFDLCTDTQLIAAEGIADLSESDLQISSKLNWATLNTTVNVTDSLSGNTFDVFVSLSWTGIGPITHEMSNVHFRGEDCFNHNRFRGTLRAAEVSGNVSDGTTNYTPEASVGANLISSNSSDMSIGCNLN